MIVLGSGGDTEASDKSMRRYNRNNNSPRNTLREHLTKKSKKE